MAYLLSPSRVRHPYLLWSSLVIGLGWSGEAWAKVRGKASEKGVVENKRGKRAVREGSWTEDEDWMADEGNVNGEVVREGMEGWRAKQGWKAGIWGVGWAMAVVGIWGDGS